MTTMTASVRDARNHFSKIANEVNLTGQPVTVFRNSKPWVVISPAAHDVPNATTLRAMAEAEEMASDPNHNPYDTFEDMMNALNKACEDA